MQVSQVYYSKFMCRSACFGCLHTHHQEPTTALTASGFTLERGGSSVVGRGLATGQTTTNNTTHKRRVINLWNCCIWLVHLFQLYEFVHHHHHHHHHVQEGLGLIPVPCILKMKLVPPSLPRSSYVSSSFWFICMNLLWRQIWLEKK